MPAHSHEVRGIIERSLSGAVCDGSTNYKIALINMPSDAERGRLKARHIELMNALRDHDRKEIGALIAEMLGSYDVAKKKYKTKKEMLEVVAKYVQELRGVPTWAVQIACEKIRMGTEPDISHVYEPTTIQVRVLAVSIAQPFKQETINIGNIMIAAPYSEPVSEVERERVAPLLADLASKMKLKLEEDYRDRVERDAPRVAQMTEDMIKREYAARGDAPRYAGDILVSPSLVKLIEKKKAEQAAMPGTDPMVL
jgi:hypothetical protein